MAALSSPLFVLLVSFVAYRLVTQEVLSPSVWSDAPPLRELSGPWAPNELLKGARHDAWNGTAISPETFALDNATKYFYASASHAVICVPSYPGAPAAPVFFTPAAVDGWHGAPGDHPLFKFCKSAARNRNYTAEEVCGRPLGIRVARSVLYVADAYFGVFSAPLSSPSSFAETGVAHPPFTWLVRPTDATPTLRFVNDLDVLSDGSVVFTDSSAALPRRKFRAVLLNNHADGRLFVKRPGQALQLIAGGLHFPNGVQSLPSDIPGRPAVAVAELGRRRLLRCAVPPPPAAVSDDAPEAAATAASAEDAGCSVLSANLPCLADNVRSHTWTGTKSGAPLDTLLVACGAKVASPFSLPHTLWSRPRLAIFVHRLLTFYPPVEDAVVNAVSKYGLVLVVNARTGAGVASFHDPNAGASISTAIVANGRLWLGSPVAHYAASLAWPLQARRSDPSFIGF